MWALSTVELMEIRAWGSDFRCWYRSRAPDDAAARSAPYDRASMPTARRAAPAPAAPSSTHRRKSARTRAALAAATWPSLAATATFTAEQVAARAGTAPATFFAHFPTKDQALVAALALTLDELVARTNAGLQVEALLDDGLERTCARLVAELVALFRRCALVFRAALARMVEVRTRCGTSTAAASRRRWPTSSGSWPAARPPAW